METITYPSSVEVATYSVTTIPTSETVAITILEPDVLATSVISATANTQGTLFINLTIGSLTNCIIRLYGSYIENPTTSDWFQETIESDSTGTVTLYPAAITLTSSSQIMWHFPIGGLKAYKITVQGTGTATNSTLTLAAGLRVN